jgi:hypothetical protein
MDLYVGGWTTNERNGLGLYVYTNGDLDRGLYRGNDLVERRELLLADLSLHPSVLQAARTMLPNL